ncbi:MAG: Mut7-C RNAse domain-containing protein, partial [Nitrososphaeraceae archaeon]
MKSVEANRQPHRDLAFFADSMHGSLARKLRIFGIDTAYSSSISDNHLLMECSNQRRILLTSDKELFKRALNKQIGSVLLKG